jgi:hypothetical protein
LGLTEVSMTKAQDPKKVVVVTGDVTMDWHLAHSHVPPAEITPWNPEEKALSWNPGEKTMVCWERGGAARLGDLIARMAKKLGNTEVRMMAAPSQLVRPTGLFFHSYALWSFFRPRKEDSDLDKGAWRVSRFLGVHHPQANRSPSPSSWQLLKNDVPDPFLMVLDDANLIFRNTPEVWPRAIKEKNRSPWIILKMASPVAEGELWQNLVNYHAGRLITVISANDLRRTHVQISRELSWERTALELVWELMHNPHSRSLMRCSFVVISFESAGVVLYSRFKTKGSPFTLFFHPQMMEGVWVRHHQGSAIGYHTCLVAGLARQLMEPGEFDPAKGIRAGIMAMRKLHREGYDGDPFGRKGTPLKFPFNNIIGEMERIGELEKEKENKLKELEEEIKLVAVEIPRPCPADIGACSRVAEAKPWTILQARYTTNLALVAQQTVFEGPETTLKSVPVGQFGKLTTVDRQEIESLRTIRNLIREYYCQLHAKKPISIAVFGPPGAGKSFGITEVAKSLFKETIRVLEFNLSQFNDPQELFGAFHQVRDAGLSGKLPLVFWDEFDAALQGEDLGWLRYFLAPMQDGTFLEGQITHPLGRAIFVFAGGTSTTMERFRQTPESRELQKLEAAAEKTKRMDELRELLNQFRMAKGPDFVSRIKGHVNILGPNRYQSEVDEGNYRDPFFIIRRAIILRTLFQRHWPKLFYRENGPKGELLDIDPGVLKAFLEVGIYLHGVRSMETIISNSLLYGQHRFERSSLPPEDQLNLHVDGREFLSLVQQVVIPPDKLESMAKLVHENFLDCHPESDLPRDYDALDEGIKISNRGFVLDIPAKLGRLGYSLVKVGKDFIPYEFSKNMEEQLAEMEHERWMMEKIELGWRWGPIKDSVRKEHPDLLHWRQLSPGEKEQLPKFVLEAIGAEDLPEEEKNKDRCMVRNIPKLLAEVGYSFKLLCHLTVGVTGHRIMMELDKIETGLDEAFKKIKQTFPGQPLVVISSLAEGADRLVARRVVPGTNDRLIVVLPLKEKEYLKDFKNARSKKEFRELLKKADLSLEMAAAPSREEAYEAAGNYVLNHCDVLITVWDGQGAQGVGGTGGIIAEARRRKMPIAWVHAGNRKPGTEEPTSLGKEQGEVSLENFPGW